MTSRPAVFLDKDGTLVEDVPYNVTPRFVRLMPRAEEGLRRLHHAGYRLVVITNQSGVARGYFTEDQIAAVGRHLTEVLARIGVPLTAFYYCPHYETGRVAPFNTICDCRKPEPGLLLRAAADHRLDLSCSWFIGDIASDVEAGRRAGCRTVLVEDARRLGPRERVEPPPDLVASDLDHAAALITGTESFRSARGGAREREPATSDLPGLLSSFRGRRLLVVGESMLDSYLRGPAQRLCREAPVPIVDVSARTHAAGGAANVCVNAAALGAQVTFLSVVGDDTDGAILRRTLESHGVPTTHLVVANGRQTLSKNRVVAGDQLVVRFDQGTTEPLDAATEADFLERLGALHAIHDAVIVSDYGYGVLTERIRHRLGELQAAAPRPLVVDAKDPALYREMSVTAAKPNYGEAVRLLGEREHEGVRVRVGQIVDHAERLHERTGAPIVAVTLDADGALVFEQGMPAYRTYAGAAAQRRAAGAGDTFVAALTLALVSGAPTSMAAELASAAAAVVVGKDGTSVCSVDELHGYLLAEDKLVVGLDALAAQMAFHRQQGRRIVFTNGCFDILHHGHITYLNRAKALGDVLIVGVNSDASVRRLKGEGRPINTLSDRVGVLAALSSVDHIVAFEEDTPAGLIRLVRPDVFAKGGDYRAETLPEAPLVEELGGDVRILPYTEDRSTTGIIARIRARALPVESP